MPPADLLIPFFVASAVFACVPGPGMFYAAAKTLAAGRRAGWWAAAGFHLAGLGHVAAAAFGVSTLLAVVPALFTAMKLLGAAYLVWLGIKCLRGMPAVPASAAAAVPAGRSAMRDSIVAEAMNPKSALFYLAFLPQFADASAALPVWAQIVVLGTIINALFSLTDIVLIETSHVVATKMRGSRRLVPALQRIAGGVLIALGVKLALSRSP